MEERQGLIASRHIPLDCHIRVKGTHPRQITVEKLRTQNGQNVQVLLIVLYQA
jgi:hypothetical protein